MTRPMQMFVGVGLFAITLLARGWFETTLIRHMLLQYPLLIVAGTLIAGSLLPFGKGEWNRGGLACLLVAIFATLFWMLPRMIDASVAELPIDLAKAVCLAGLVGCGLRLGWPRAHPLFRAVLKANAISMLGILAFLYSHAPARLCNAYLMDQQRHLGLMFLCVGFALAAFWTAMLVSAPRSSSPLSAFRR